MQKAFINTPIVSFKRTKIVEDILVVKTIINDKLRKPEIIRGQDTHVRRGKTQFATNKGLTRHRFHAIKMMECTLCKIQSYRIHVNNLRSDVSRGMGQKGSPTSFFYKPRN